MAPPKSSQTITRPQQSRPSTSQSPAFTILKQKLIQGNHLISKALDFDEEINANSRMEKAQVVERAKMTLKLYLDGGEVLKTILNTNSEQMKLSRYNFNIITVI